ncbi:DUF6803 family protein [Bacillus smithii]|uniref:DUF6803 family protein n=1 Tax=Bacillus smithii TaxID=1479 RepID=UPI003D1DE074
MQMTHFMSLLAKNQPWNLIIFMAIPMIMIETIAITEFSIIFNQQTSGTLRLVNKIASIFIGFYFTGISIYLFKNVVIPLTQTGGWLTWVDVAAVVINLSGVFFLIPLALMELGLIFKKKTEEEKIKIHFMLVSGFLVVGHIAMIFAMVDPSIISQTTGNMNMRM